MFTDTRAIQVYFAKLGLGQEIADMYLSLHAHGPQSISELSRTSHVERTRIYRLIDTLMESNLIEVDSRGARGIIKAAPIANLHILINQKEQELRSLQDELGLIEQVLARNSLSSPAIRVQTYQGREGIRHMLWNELEAKTEIVGYDYYSLDDLVGKKIAENWQDACSKRSTLARNVLNDTTTHPFTYTCHIYDDIVASYYIKDGDAYGMEMHNKEVADAQGYLLAVLREQQQHISSYSCYS